MLDHEPLACRAELPDGKGVTEPVEPTRVVWWREPSEDSSVPPLSAIAWSATHSLEYGTAHIPNGPRDVPDVDAISAKVAEAAQQRLGQRRIVVDHVGDRLEEFLPARRLAAAGIAVTSVDFGVSADLDVVGGVTAELDAGGIVEAMVLVREGLFPMHARRVIAWSEKEIAATRADPHTYDWYEAGWRQAGGQRWQILARS